MARLPVYIVTLLLGFSAESFGFDWFSGFSFYGFGVNTDLRVSGLDCLVLRFLGFGLVFVFSG